MGGGNVGTLSRFRGTSEYHFLYYFLPWLHKIPKSIMYSSLPARVNPVSSGPLAYTSSSLPTKVSLMWCVQDITSLHSTQPFCQSSSSVLHSCAHSALAIMPRWGTPCDTPNPLLIQASCPSKMALVQHTPRYPPCTPVSNLAIRPRHIWRHPRPTPTPDTQSGKL